MLLLLLFITSVISLNNLYIMRHCEKNKNDCCSLEGMRKIKFDKNVKIRKIYTAGFSTKEKCLNDLPYIRNKHCQKSKRMIITSHLINENLNTTIDYSLCTGQETLLLEKIGNEIGDILVIWNHQGIEKIYKKLNQKIDKVEYNKIYTISTKKLNFNEKKVKNKNIIYFLILCLVLFLIIIFIIHRIFFRRRQYYQIII